MKHARNPTLATLGMALALSAASAHAADDPATTLCRTNPAFSMQVMRAVLEAQLAKDHDPALDQGTPEQVAAEAIDQGVSECATQLQRDPATFQFLSGLSAAELPLGWDAYNTACDDRRVSKADCVKAEVGSVRALKRMVATNQPPGARALAQTCELVLHSDPPMADWRQCVDETLALHAPESAAVRCKTSVTWHVAATGADASRIIGQCLSRQGAGAP